MAHAYPPHPYLPNTITGQVRDKTYDNQAQVCYNNNEAGEFSAAILLQDVQITCANTIEQSGSAKLDGNKILLQSHFIERRLLGYGCAEVYRQSSRGIAPTAIPTWGASATQKPTALITSTPVPSSPTAEPITTSTSLLGPWVESPTPS